MLLGKNNKVYQWSEIASTSILDNENLLKDYSLLEIDNIYKSYKLGNYEFLYKDILLKQIYLYDQSDEVNSFIYKGNKYWLDKQQRSCMKTITESGLEEIEIVIGNSSVIFSSEFVKQFIIALETYAYKCYIVTSKHIENIKSLQTVEDILNYDFTIGYPDKIILE